MKELIQAFVLLFFIFSNLTLANAYCDYNTLDSLNEEGLSNAFMDSDSLLNKGGKWPSCPAVETSRLIILDEETYLLKWESLESDEVEYNVQILDGEKVVLEERNNAGVFIFQLPKSISKGNISINITSVCYYDFDNAPISSETYNSDWSQLYDRSVSFCDSYEDLIKTDDLKSFFLFDTQLPFDVNYTFDICQGDDCHDYNHGISNSAVLPKTSEVYSISKPKLLTKFGNFTCNTNRSTETICDAIEVSKLENCLYEITYPESMAPVCDLSLLNPNITHSLCGEATGRIVIKIKNGNMPYHYTWSTGDEGFDNDLNYLLPGTYTVTVTDAIGCEVVSNIEVEESASIDFYANGGDGGLTEILSLPPGMSVVWKFDPIGVSDQFIISGQSLDIDTGPITINTESACNSNSSCSCSLVFMGDYNDGDNLPIASGEAVKYEPYAVGDFIVPVDGILNFNVVGGNCNGGTGWTLKLECNESGVANDPSGQDDIKYVTYPSEVNSYLKSGMISKEQYLIDSLKYFNYQQKLNKAYEDIKPSLRNGTNTTTLDFRCSGLVAAPYTIKMVNYETEEMVSCDIIDQVSCPECNESTGGCQYIEYSLDSDPWDPYCQFKWEVNAGIEAAIEIRNELGGIELQTSETSGQWEFENGEVYEVKVMMENDTLSEECNFTIECPEPDLPPIDETICEYFNDFGVSLENENSLLFFSEANLSQTEIEEFNLLVSQIADIRLDIKWELGPELENHLLFDAENGGTANLFQLDPENMTFILDDYDMLNVWNQILQGTVFGPEQRIIEYKFTILDIYGNEIFCNFESIVEFPEEEEEETNPLCLSCENGEYDPDDDLEGYTLSQGEPYAENLTGETVYLYGFPIHITSHNVTAHTAEGILSLPFKECKVLAVDLTNLEVVELPIEKRLWIAGGEVNPHDTYPSQVPNFSIAPDFEFGAEICVENRGANDADGDGIDDSTGLNKYGFDSNGMYKGESLLDDNGFDSIGYYQGCPRIDDPTLDCIMYNDDGCNRDGLDENGNPCPGIDDEEWTDFVDTYEESSDSLIAAIVCEFANTAIEDKDEKTAECDSLRNEMNTYIEQSGLSTEEVKLIKGDGSKYINPGLSEYFTDEPKVPSPAVGGRSEFIKKIEKIHVELYYCDKKLQPIEDEAEGLEGLCSVGNTTELQAFIDAALEQLSNLDKQRLMLDENAFQTWIEDKIKEYINEEYQIYIGSVIPKSFEIDLFNKPTEVFYHGSYNSLVSNGADIDPFKNFEIMDAIDFEYKQGFDEINGVTRAFYVSQLGKYNQENYSSLSGVEPVAIQSVQKSSIFSIYLVNFRFSVDSPALVDAYIELADPKSDRKIYFSAKDVEYNPNGIENATMELATTISKFKINNAARGTILKGPGTFLDFDCSGVKRFGIKGEVEFCDNIIIPMQPIEGKNDYERHDDEYFTLGIEVVFDEWLEFETEITPKSAFAMAKQEDLIWKVPNFSFDFNSHSSKFAESFTVPPGFNSEFVEGGKLGDGWKGFYCPSLEAILPAITKSDSGDRFSALNVKNLLIDKYGVTCSAEVSTQILGLGEPNMKSKNESTGWSLSVDYFRLDAVQNHIVGGGLRGKIITSLFKDDENSALEYSALILPGQKYKFSVKPKVNLEVPMLVANAEIKSAAIGVTYDASDESFEASAKFTGNIKINNDLAGAALPYLKFKDLTVTNKAPYLLGGKWELKSSSGPNGEKKGSFKGFEFSLDNLKFEDCEGGPILSSSVNIGFGMNGDNEGGSTDLKSSNISIKGDFALRGKFEPKASGLQAFKFDKAFLNGLSVSGSIGEAVKDIDVKLCWDENNPDYGDTFYGSGKAKILDFGEVGVAAQFGEKDGVKYFFVDAFAEIPTIPIGGPIGINMIGAGVSNNMSLENEASGTGNPSSVPNSEVCSPPSCASNFGTTYTGFKYNFDASKSIAVKLSVGFGMTTPPKEFIEGTAGIDLTFNDNGGISKLGFFGEATLLATFPGKLGKVVDLINEAPLDKLGGIKPNGNEPLDLGSAKPNLSGLLPIMARVEGSWDFGNNHFDLTAGAFLDWGVLRGAGADNALVLGKIHIGDGWHVSLGTPSSPSGVLFDLGVVQAEFKTYFMAGSPMSEPWVPYLPEKVSKFFGGVNDFEFLETMPASGAGFAFGVHFSAGFNISVPILGSAYADLMAGIDVALVNGIRCNGNPIGFGSGDSRWYAMGQAYLYAGAGLKVLGVDLIKGEAGIMMNAGLTQPSFFNGRLKVAGKFGVSPLSFKINGSINVKLGNEPNCDWYVYDPAEALEVVGELSIVESTLPTAEEEDVTTSLTKYVINYSIPMGEEISLVYPDTIDGGGIVDRTVTYKTDISNIRMVSTKTGLIADFNPTDDDDLDVIKLHGSLASDDLITVQITYNVDIKIPDSDNFIEALEGEVLEYTFKTGPLVLRFEESNIKATWPEKGMNNFYLSHRLQNGSGPEGYVSFRNRFPWEIFERKEITVKVALYTADSNEPIMDVVLDDTRYFDVNTGTPTNAGNLFFSLEDIVPEKNYKVTIYALEEGKDEKIPLMDPIHFRTSKYTSLEAKFAEADSMFYVEASPRIGTRQVSGKSENYVCGYEFNLMSKPEAPESWDAFDAKHMRFGPLCKFDKGNYNPQLNSPDFVDCKFVDSDASSAWESFQPVLYGGVGDVLTMPGPSNLTSDNNDSSTREVTGPIQVSPADVYLYYKAFESLYFKTGGFPLKSCQ